MATNSNMLIELNKKFKAVNKEYKQIEDKLQTLKSNILYELLQYHKELYNLDFYTKCVFNYLDSYPQVISDKMTIREYCLPYNNHCEGDYVKIKFYVLSKKLKLVYQNSYDKYNNRHLLAELIKI